MDAGSSSSSLNEACAVPGTLQFGLKIKDFQGEVGLGLKARVSLSEPSQACASACTVRNKSASSKHGKSWDAPYARELYVEP